MSFTRVRRRLVLLSGAAALIAAPVAAGAQTADQPMLAFDLPAMSLDDALKAIGRQADREIVYPEELMRARGARPLRARLTADDAIRAVLTGSGLDVEFRPDVVIIRGRMLPSDGEGGPAANPDVIVTGTRIRGAGSASPRVVVSRETLRGQGFADLGDFARSLPQNYGGGQNPGVVGGGAQGIGNENITSSSTLNLRGLGPDATLTLVNGHRVAFDGVLQGIDIAAIPLLAIDRVEVVTDGASAIYGSDAVGGVANIILRRSFDGLLAAARLGTTTRGGATRDQFDAVTGTHWPSGSMMAALSYNHTTAITAAERSFTRSINGSTTLLPKQDQVSGVLVVAQRLTDKVALDLDAAFNRRRSFQATANTFANSFLISGQSLDPHVRFVSVSPKVTVDLAGGWQLTGSGSYSQSNTAFSNRNYAGGLEAFRVAVRYRDRLVAAEIGAEGPLFALPAGDVRLSLGAGLRGDRLVASQDRIAGATTTRVQAFADTQDVRFAYGELFAPFVGSANAQPLLRKLELSAAARYEHYSGAEGLMTPKVGLVYAPADALVLKGTYGKSFKAPTLYQLNLIRNGSIFPASFIGAAGAGPNVAVANVGGGNPNLASEKATTWSATAELLPPGVEGLSFQATYYRIAFDQRVVTPIASYAGLLTNPIYRQLIVFNPTPAQVAASAATLPLGFTNITGQPVSALNIVALIDNTNQNAATQKIRGVDLATRYDLPAGGRDRLSLAASASYLRIDQRLSVGQPLDELTGLIFRPPHWRARGSADWDRGAIGGSLVVNYIGATIDRRFVPDAPGRGFGTLDLIGRARVLSQRDMLAGLDVNLAVLNVFDRVPDVIRNTNPANPPYESTNYSALGRTVSITLSKRW